jgi:hypothetical protein
MRIISQPILSINQPIESFNQLNNTNEEIPFKIKVMAGEGSL